MSTITKILSMSLIAGLMIIGCQSQQNMVTPSRSLSLNPNTANPAVFTVDSAFFTIYVMSNNMATVNVHRVTADWAESTVTWNNFGGAFNSDVEGSFMADANDFHNVNITDLVRDWIEGDHSNFGLLLEQGNGQSSEYASSETSQVDIRPMLTIYLTTNAGPEVDEFQRGSHGDVADAWINHGLPDNNFGSTTDLFSGFSGDTERQTLIRFNINIQPPPPEEGCTRGSGYWKNHAGFGPQANVVTPFLPIWLGMADSIKSIHVTDSLIAYNVFVMRTYGLPRNGITKLYAQLLGAKLNIANGASDTDVVATIALADAFLATHDWNDWTGISQADKQMVLQWMGILGSYNEGEIGPTQCDDVEEHDNIQ
jgi:hypothetical protein